MLKFFKQTRIMTKEERKLYIKDSTLFHEILANKSILYHIKTCYIYSIKLFISLMYKLIKELCSCVFPIITNILFLPIALFIATIGAISRKKFHKKIVEGNKKCHIV